MRRSDLLAIIAVALLGALALWPYLFEHKALYWGDIELYFAPMQQFLHANLSRGIIPLWNPYILCGEPFAGDPQTWPLYPSTVFAGLVSPWIYLTIDASLHLILGGIFFYALVRDDARSRAASILAAVSFMLGGYFATKVQFPNMAQAIAYAPGLLWLAGRFARMPSFRAALPLGVLLGLELLAAHAQVTLITGYFAVAYALFCAWPRLRVERRLWIPLIGWAAFAGLFALCLDAGQLLPVLELWRNSDRHVLTLAGANRFVQWPGQQIGFIWPNAFGSPYGENFSELGNYWEAACYLGVLPCIFAVFGIFNGLRNRSRIPVFWLIVFLVSIWLAEGRNGGLYTVVFYILPGVHAFHDPSRMLLGAAIAGPILAAIGFDELLIRLSYRIQLAVAVAAILLTTIDMAHFVRHAYPLMPVQQIEVAVQASASDSAALALPGHRVGFPPDNRITWLYFVDYTSYRLGETSYLPSLLETHTSNTSMLSGLSDAGGYEPEPPSGAVGRYIQAYNAHFRGDDTGLDRLCVDSLISFEPAADSSRSGFFRAHRRIVLTNPRRAAITRARLESGAYLPVTDLTPDLVTIAVPPHLSPERLVLADTEMPGWEAEAIGRPLPIDRTSDGFRQVELLPSSSATMLIFRYRPTAWLLGLYITLISLAITIGYYAYAVSSSERKLQR